MSFRNCEGHISQYQKYIIPLFFVFLIVYGKGCLFPSDEDIIQNNSEALAELVSKEKKESVFKTAQKLTKALDHFSVPIDLRIVDQGIGHEVRIKTLDEVKASLAKARFPYKWLNVSWEELDIVVDGALAESEGIVRLEFESRKQGLVYTLYSVKLSWVKNGGNWLIQSVRLSREGE